MKLKISNVHDNGTVCPSQFDFEIKDHPIFKAGYIRYRYGFLRCDLYDEKGFMEPNRCYGMKLSHNLDGEIDFRSALDALRCNMGVILKWDGTEACNEGEEG